MCIIRVCVYMYIFCIDFISINNHTRPSEPTRRITKTPSVVAAFYIWLYHDAFFHFSFFFFNLFCFVPFEIVLQFNLAIGRFSTGCLFGLFTRPTHTNSIHQHCSKCWVNFFKMNTFDGFHFFADTNSGMRSNRIISVNTCRVSVWWINRDFVIVNLFSSSIFCVISTFSISFFFANHHVMKKFSSFD